MTGRAAAFQGLLAALGLLAAFLTWQRDPSLESDAAYVLDVTKNQLEKIRFEEGAVDPGTKTAKEWVELFRTDDTVWVRLSGREGGNMPLPSGHPVVQSAVPERVVRGSASATKMWELFAPLRASRALGTLDDKMLQDLGLKPAPVDGKDGKDGTKKIDSKRLLVTAKGVTRTFTLVPSPPGGTEPYLRSDDDGRVFIVNRQILTDFESARSNLVERKLHDFMLQDFDKMVVTVGDKKKDYTFKKYEDRPGGQLLPAGAGDKPDETAANWHERVFALFPADVMGKDEAPVAGTPRTALRIDYFYRGRPLGWLELARVGADGQPVGGDPSVTPPRSEALARSEFTAGWMKLSVDAQPLVEEGVTLFGAPPAPAKPPKP